MVAEQKMLNFATIKAIAEQYDTSQTATAIRFIQSDHTPAMLVCHGPSGRRWFIGSPSVPHRWFPQDQLDADSFAFDIQFGSESDTPMFQKIEADAWFDRVGASYFEIQEQTIVVGPDETLTLLIFTDDEMLEEE